MSIFIINCVKKTKFFQNYSKKLFKKYLHCSSYLMGDKTTVRYFHRSSIECNNQQVRREYCGQDENNLNIKKFQIKILFFIVIING